MTGVGSKEAKRTGKTPMQLVAEVTRAKNDSHPSANLFREYARSFKGKQKITINGDLKSRYLTTESELEAAMNDEQLAAKKEAGEVIGHISKPIWREITKTANEDLVKAHAEAGGMEEVAAVLNEIGIRCHYDPGRLLVRSGSG